MKKIAIFHNFMDNIGGAEAVTLTLARELGADIYTTNIDEVHIREMGFEDVLPRIKSIGRVPVHAPLRHQLTFWRFKKLNLGNQYDFYIIGGDWAMSGASHNKPNAWYVHSPMHEIWAFKEYIRDTMLPSWKRPVYDAWVWLNRRLTLKYAKHVEMILCNSENTADRVKQYYGRDSEVVPPPTYVDEYAWKSPKNYWLGVNRFVVHKKIELQMEAFAKLVPEGEKAIMVCSYEKGAAQFESYKAKIESIKPENVEIRSWVTHDELLQLYSECKGHITTATREDFGLTAIEAMASGKPVIAPNEGGYRESVIDGKTGILIDGIDSEKIAAAVREIERNLAADPLHYRDACVARAREFDVKVFMDRIKKAIGA